DTSAPTFRHKEFKAYKATRQKMPEDMASQLDVLKDVVRAYGVPVIEVDGYEADDIMGTLARRAEKENVETILVTSDKDFMQLVTDRIRIYRPGRQGTDVEIVGFEEVRRKFGVGPENVVDVLGLIGDKSDNIPGVPGIGEKTAIPLIQDYRSIENLLENVDSIPQKGIREKLQKFKKEALLSKKLVTIDTNVPLSIDFHTLKSGASDIDKLAQLFDELEFKSLLRKLRETSAPASTPAPSPEPAPLANRLTDQHEYHVVRGDKELDTLCRTLESSSTFVFDTETTSPSPLLSRIVGIAFSVREHQAYYVPLDDPDDSVDLFGTPVATRSSSGTRGLPAKTALQKLRPVFENSSIQKIGQNIKYDMLVLSRYGIQVQGIDFDTMVAAYLLRQDGQHNLDALAREYLGYKTLTYDELTGTGKERKDILSIPLDRLAEYSCEDADITFRLSVILRRRLEEEGMSGLAHDVEFPLIQVLAHMEQSGVAIDVPFLQTMGRELDGVLDSLTREIHKEAGGPFNINSTKQLQEVLFTKLALASARKTKTGFSTDVAVLETLRDVHPIIEKLLEYRQLTKLKSTYIDALPQLIHPTTGRVHTSFNQTVAATGRLSSSDPNLQNIPIRTDIGRSIRKAFVPSGEGRKILAADYSQIELRVMAHISGDRGLIEAFLAGEDIHASTAAKVFGVDQKDVSRDMRRKAKEVNFGIMYGIGPFGLARRLEISQPEAKEIIEKYFERFPKVRQYINDTIQTAKTRGYVSTLLGRRRYLPDLRSRNQNIRSNAERQAINMPIQGTAADMIKAAMVGIDSEFVGRKLTSTMILQVHDELVFDVDRREESDVRKIVEKNMKGALKLEVPIEVDIGVGGNWFEAH
ncbi:MAG: DNA polymerase I, partial [Ignavibacteriales bacterium]|nr:DNA polymerase I [Ignavibacteriales bacterium]